MVQRLSGLFLLCCLYSAPVYAVTIVDVSEVSTTIWQEYISECEWIENIEIRTTTTYRDVYYSHPILPNEPVFPVHTGLTRPRIIAYSGFRNPCFPEFEDENTVIPDYCTAELRFPGMIGGGVGRGFSPVPLFREWSELSVSYNLVHHNECDPRYDPTLDPILTSTPEPVELDIGLEWGSYRSTHAASFR